jgi:hypothetical protein
MADTKISAATNNATVAAADEFATNKAGASRRTPASAIATYVKGVSELFNANVTSQSGFSSDTYLTNSNISIPANNPIAKTMYRCVFRVTKTAAGTATATINVRYGTNGTTADTSRGLITFPSAQTAATDSGIVEIWSTFRTVGSGTSAVLQTAFRLSRTNTTTGFLSTGGITLTFIDVTSGGFDSTPANSIIGLSVNGGASANWTIALAQVELINLSV